MLCICLAEIHDKQIASNLKKQSMASGSGKEETWHLLATPFDATRWQQCTHPVTGFY
jgi:hypothetical protein